LIHEIFESPISAKLSSREISIIDESAKLNSLNFREISKKLKPAKLSSREIEFP